MAVLDHRMLATHRAGRVLALDASSVGASVSLRSEQPAQSVPPASATKRPAVAIVDILGPLAQRGEQHMCGFVDGYDWIGERLGAALEAADTVVLRIDSPGGDVAGLVEGVRRMRAAVEASGKRVVAYVDELAASAAYWIAAGVADEIIVPLLGRVGSIGCFGMLVDATAADQQDGLAIQIIRDPAGKAEAHPAAPITGLAVERLQAEVSAVTSLFVDAIAVRRGLSTTVLRALNGAELRGADAVAAGLADRVGTLEDTIGAARAATTKGLQMISIQTAAGPKSAPEAPPTDPEKPAAVDPVPVEAGMVTCPECNTTFPIALPKAPADAPPTEDAKALAALVDTTGAKDLGGVLVVVASLRAELGQLRAHVERRTRADLGAALVRSGIPGSQVWRDPIAATDVEHREVSALYAAMPLDELRAMAARTASAPLPAAFAVHKPIAASAAGLSAFEITLCKAYGHDPAEYLKTKAAMRGGRA